MNRKILLMQHSIHDSIHFAKANGTKLLAILLDPDKIDWAQTDKLVQKIKASPATHIFVGGSIVESDSMSKLIDTIKSCGLPLCIFPGHPSQISNNADGILLLSLLSGRNPDYLIQHHVDSAKILKTSRLEIIPTAYLLIDGGTESAVKTVSKTMPLSQNNIDEIVSTAIAGELLGKKLLYLEAGSGAKNRVCDNIISAVCSEVEIPVIVGGGISSSVHIQQVYEAGATMVVIGTAFEKNSNFFETL